MTARAMAAILAVGTAVAIVVALMVAHHGHRTPTAPPSLQVAAEQLVCQQNWTTGGGDLAVQGWTKASYVAACVRQLEADPEPTVTTTP